jgi:cytochrome P450
MPAYRSCVHPAWIVSRYADVDAILRHPQSVAVEAGKSLQPFDERAGVNISSLVKFCSSLSFFTIPPRHDPVRRVLAQSAAAIRRPTLPASLERRADQLLEAGRRQGSMDLAGGYGQALALFVIGTFFGIPDSDLPRLSALVMDLMVIFEFTVPSVKSLLRLNECARELTEYFARLVVARRADPGSDGISLMTRICDEQLHQSNEDIGRYCLTFFITAEVTTAAAISAAAFALLEHSEFRATLRAELSLLPSAALESLRLNSPVQYVARQLSVDTEIAGHAIRAGDPILLMLGSANRDGAAFANPNDFVLRRLDPKPLVFAAGAYSCIGMQLAMLEVEIAMKKILERPNLRCSDEPPVWSTRRNFESLERAPAIFI